jgi:hypothetical protein
MLIDSDTPQDLLRIGSTYLKMKDTPLDPRAPEVLINITRSHKGYLLDVGNQGHMHQRAQPSRTTRAARNIRHQPPFSREMGLKSHPDLTNLLSVGLEVTEEKNVWALSVYERH